MHVLSRARSYIHRIPAHSDVTYSENGLIFLLQRSGCSLKDAESGAAIKGQKLVEVLQKVSETPLYVTLNDVGTDVVEKAALVGMFMKR